MLENKGITLIEMIIVLAIIGIIAVTVYPNITGAVAMSNENDRAKQEYVANKALKEYYALTGSYPSSQYDKDSLAKVLNEETGVSLNTSYNYIYTVNKSNQVIAINVE